MRHINPLEVRSVGRRVERSVGTPAVHLVAGGRTRRESSPQVQVVVEALNAGSRQVTPGQSAGRFTGACFRDEERIGIVAADVFPRPPITWSAWWRSPPALLDRKSTRLN